MGPWEAAASAGFVGRWSHRAAASIPGVARLLVAAATAGTTAGTTVGNTVGTVAAVATVALTSIGVAAPEMALAGAPAGQQPPLAPRQPHAAPARERRPLRVTFLGDSITAAGDWQRRFPDALHTNAGRSGDTTLDLLARLGPVRAGRPQMVLLMVGINDLLRGGREQAVAERIALIRQLLADQRRVRVIQQSTLSCEASRCGAAMVARVRRLNRVLRAGVAAGDFLDVDAVLSDATGLKPMYSLDGLHLTPAAYSRWQELLRARLGRHLGRSSALP
ncbi:MAG: GDSL-type esterase/lipase family protein [Synechococcaceae cyanobacterium]